LIESIALGITKQRVPSEDDWMRASDHIRRQSLAGDGTVVAPSWADPLLRLHLGNRMSLGDAAPSDISAYERLWVVSSRGALHPWEEIAASRTSEPPNRWDFGLLSVRLWQPLRSPLLYDFVAHVEEANVQFVEGSLPRHCPLERRGVRGGSGLFQGPMAPGTRHVCDRKRSWLWVGATVIEDLELKPRRCVWMHPAGREPVSILYEQVPRGSHVVVYAGLYYIHEREGQGGPVTLSVRSGSEAIGQLVHHDGDGWKRMVAKMPEHGAAFVDVTFEATAPDPHFRTLCWAATMRRGDIL
ncbi:MAG: hypothetical protein AAF550_06255, partial [Myxococcota bacterium]